MARIACGRQSLELPDRCALVTCVAIERGMCSLQRESVLVVLNLLDGRLPASHGVTLLTARTELPLVNVRVAVGTLCPHIREYGLGMARHACYSLVHAAQRISRLIVIELGNTADRLPSTEGMAVLARNIQVAMRAVRSGAVLLRLRKSGSHNDQ